MIEYIRRRLLKKNKNWIAIICGETGSGKSYTALRLAELIDPNFNIDKLVFTSEEFMKLLNSGTLKKGDCIIFDEAGVGIPAREWYTISNKLIMYILQVFRYKNLAVIFTTPSIDFIDIHARKLIHAYIETKSINYEKKQTIVAWFNLQYNPRMGKTYTKYPIYKTEKIKKVKRIRINMPSLNLIDAYEGKKSKYAKALGIDVEQTIKKTHIKYEPKPLLSLNQMVEQLPLNEKITIPMIENKFDVGGRVAAKIKAKWIEAQNQSTHTNS